MGVEFSRAIDPFARNAPVLQTVGCPVELCAVGPFIVRVYQFIHAYESAALSHSYYPYVTVHIPLYMASLTSQIKSVLKVEAFKRRSFFFKNLCRLVSLATITLVRKHCRYDNGCQSVKCQQTRRINNIRVSFSFSPGNHVAHPTITN